MKTDAMMDGWMDGWKLASLNLAARRTKGNEQTSKPINEQRCARVEADVGSGTFPAAPVSPPVPSEGFHTRAPVWERPSSS